MMFGGQNRLCGNSNFSNQFKFMLSIHISIHRLNNNIHSQSYLKKIESNLPLKMIK